MHRARIRAHVNDASGPPTTADAEPTPSHDSGDAVPITRRTHGGADGRAAAGD
jgi:hypothetical protein